jgi:uncharacterized iron-regulated membrane protein
VSNAASVRHVLVKLHRYVGLALAPIDPATGEPFELDYNQVFANPYTGERLGDRFIGHFSLQPKDLISQIHYLHSALVLPELLGPLVLGTIGLIWAFDCFVVPLRIAVSLFGIVVAVITVTGVLIWWCKRKSRNPQPRARDARSAASVAGLGMHPLSVNGEKQT